MDYRWLAGIVDGEGSFNITIQQRPYKDRFSLVFAPRIVIGFCGRDGWAIDYIKEGTGLGSIYNSNYGKPNWHRRWQTIKIDDSITLTKIILPYLVIKKKTAERFLEVCELLKSSKRAGYHKIKGGRAYSLEASLKIAEIATTLNEGRSKLRYNNYKDMIYWKPIITSLYDDTSS